MSLGAGMDSGAARAREHVIAGGNIEELYDMLEDPAEEHEVASLHPSS